jgi:sporulation protein YlmC with PRC-barrel domain
MSAPGTPLDNPEPAGGAIFLIGSEVVCGNDGERGTLVRVVIDPVARKLTHLLVEPRSGDGVTRLVPVELALTRDAAADADADETIEGRSGGSVIELSCSSEAFAALDLAEEEQFLPGAPGALGYGPDETFLQPYFGLGGGIAGGYPGALSSAPFGPQVLTYDRVPLGEVEVRRGAHVAASDGRIGSVEGLVIDPADHRVTHVLLQKGHLWGKKDVAIPIGAVEEVSDEEVRLRLSKDEVRDLPSVELEKAS